MTRFSGAAQAKSYSTAPTSRPSNGRVAVKGDRRTGRGRPPGAPSASGRNEADGAGGSGSIAYRGLSVNPTG